MFRHIYVRQRHDRFALRCVSDGFTFVTNVFKISRNPNYYLGRGIWRKLNGIAKGVGSWSVKYPSVNNVLPQTYSPCDSPVGASSAILVLPLLCPWPLSFLSPTAVGHGVVPTVRTYFARYDRESKVRVFPSSSGVIRNSTLQTL